MRSVWSTGLGRGWAWAAVASWVAVVALASFELPPVDPTLGAETRPLERIGVAALVLPAVVHGYAVIDPVPMLTRTGARPAWVVRAIRVCGHGAVVVLSAVAAAQLLGPGIAAGHVLSVVVQLWGLAVVGVCLLDVSTFAVLPLAAVALVSVAGVLPWSANTVFNLDSTPSPTLAALLLGLGGGTLLVVRGDRAARQV